MRNAGRAVTCLAIAAVLAACGRAPEPDARFVSSQEIKGLDPVFSGDAYSGVAQMQVFERLIEVHPFKEPLTLQPLLAESLPEISEDGLVFSFRLRDDAYYHDDPCFPGGKGRKVTAHDFVWCWKRLAAVPTSAGAWIFAGKVKGLDAWAERVKPKLRELLDRVNAWYPFEDDSLAALVAEEVPGLRALDDRTLRVEMTKPCPILPWLVAMNFCDVYPPEAVRRYGMDFTNRPVGCGPYRVEDYFVYDRKVVFVRNPTWHGQSYPSEGAPGDREAGLLDDAGRPLPFLDRIEYVVVKSSQTRWLKFLEGGLDRVEAEKEVWSRAMTPEGELRDDLVAKGLRAEHHPMVNVAYTAFNMDDPVVGAPAGERGRKLRQAMSLAYDRDLWIQVMRNGKWADPADGPIPPSVPGHQPGAGSPYAHRDVERAKRLLAEAGHPGGRGLPVLRLEMPDTSALTRNGSEIFRNCMAEIGVTVELSGSTWDAFLAKLEKKKAQLFGLSWNADYPDAENFLQLFFGENESPGPNGANYKNPRYDALYRRMAVMQPGPERDAVIREMLAIVNEDCPWIYTDWRVAYSFLQPWLRNFKGMAFRPDDFKYLRADLVEKARRLRTEGTSQ